jgi:hypothetical protein
VAEIEQHAPLILERVAEDDRTIPLQLVERDHAQLGIGAFRRGLGETGA